MSDTVWAAIVGGIAGVITGGISSLLAPWANWGIEKSRGVREARKAIIKNAENMIADYRRSGLAGGKLTLGTSIKTNAGWTRIQRHLNDSSRAQIRAVESQPVSSEEVKKAWTVLEGELARLREKWKLV